ncbi:DUF3189 family protein [Geosporobacter subterraneus]|uniref:DUF3189 family protein n=1 Tax=Geosporobacter subterraneus TaxID=390806 RepID=UPI001FA8B4A1|nr:DUF3189 family protein [Geosporobacter subterraneus]
MIFLHIIYHCVGGSHSSSTAAAIHLNMLPIDHTPNTFDLLHIPFYDTQEKVDRGRIFLRGIDEYGNYVYNLSRQFIPHLMLPAILDLWEILGQNKEDILFVNTMPCVNIWMKIGGFSSRRLEWVKLGRPIVAKGTLAAYDCLIKLVQETKKQFH